jgi:hypothetical protein
LSNFERKLRKAMSDEHPDMEEMTWRMDVAEEKMQTVFEVVFDISQYDAEILIECWEDATSGDTTAIYSLMGEMKKLVDVLKEEVGYID